MCSTDSVPAITAFESQLRTLCLDEFPCGIGSWRENHKVLKKKRLKKPDVSTEFGSTLKDFGAEHEKTEILEELVTAKHSPWKLDYSWSNEAQQLRETAVKSPWLIDQRYIYQHFKTLRIVNKNVTEVDEQFLQFINLQELTLSANYLQTVNSQNLPPSLQVLELYGNEISHLAELCIAPPPLLHLGLGSNMLTMVDDYIAGDYWPNLLSLDLGHNNLNDVMDIVKKLQSLPQLRNLILIGNPLALVPAYRGFVVDSLRKLDYLDDISISADEKHHFKGLSKKKEYILDEAKLMLKCDYIKGVPVPEEIKNPEEQPEFPIVTRKYFAQFMFLEDKSANAEIFQLLLADGMSVAESRTQRTEELDTIRESEEQFAASSYVESSVVPQRIDEASTQDQELASQAPAEYQAGGSVAPQVHPQVIVDEHVDLQSARSGTATQMGQEENAEVPSFKVAAVNSTALTWAEEIETNWWSRLTRDDLTALRDFFKAGMQISVMEEKVLSYPADQFQDGTLSPALSTIKGKEGKRRDSTAHNKPTKGKPEKDDAAAKKKKKKGEPDVDLVHMAPEYSTLATFHIHLEDFLEGEFEYENVFTKESEESGMESPVSDVDKHRDSKKDKKKPASAAKKKDAKDTKDGRRSARTDKKHEKDAKESKMKVKPGDSTEEEQPPPPPPLQVHVCVKLHHWKTASDCMKEEVDGESEPPPVQQ